MKNFHRKRFLIAIFFFSLLLYNCQQQETEYLNLTEFYNFLAKERETTNFNFLDTESKLLKASTKGFSHFPGKNPSIWATDIKSYFTAYFSDIGPKEMSFFYTPNNPQGKPLQKANIYINDKYLCQIHPQNKKRQRVEIPSGLLHYGSNIISFKWKYIWPQEQHPIGHKNKKFAAGIRDLIFKSKGVALNKGNIQKEIYLNQKKKMPDIVIPHGGIVEYVLELPKKPKLKFKIKSTIISRKDSKVTLAIYNKKGNSIIKEYTGGHINSKKELVLDLDRFSKQYVKIVFSNSINNKFNFKFSLVNPTVYSSAGQKSPLFWSVEQQKRKKAKAVKRLKKISQPNIFIYLIDTLRADHLSCYGYAKKTSPNIDAFAKDCMQFNKFMATASWTRPTVASILTGLYPFNHGAETRFDKLPLNVTMLAETLKASGYTTLYITHNVVVSKEVNFTQGIDIYKLSSKSSKYKENMLYHSSKAVNEDFFKILSDNTGILTKPIFAYLHTVDPHDPYTPEKPFLKFKIKNENLEELAFPDNIRRKKKEVGLSTEDIEYIKALYDCEILHNDFHFGKFIEFLKKNGLYDNSIIMLLSDHGEQFYDHLGLFHGTSIYTEEIHVPLIIKLPNNTIAGEQMDFFVSQVDLFPTILDYLDIKIPKGIDGKSIFELLNLGSGGRSIYIKEKLDGHYFFGFIRTSNNRKYIIHYNDKDFSHVRSFQKFNLERDFYEQHALPFNIKQFLFNNYKFRADYFLNKSKIESPDKVDPDKLDPEIKRQLKALGYID
jgi:arylsulfatase A-like enzyme